jgi:hypothetical protein
MTRMDRRHFLRFGGAALAVPGFLAALPAVACAGPSTWDTATSVNGWPVLTADQVRIEGNTLSVHLADAAAPVLLHVARRFVYEVESSLQPGEITGHSTDRRVGAAYESTYLSGSGIAIRPLHYPLGATEGLFPAERTVIRDILADCAGLVAWGGDLHPIKESHFHVAVSPTSRWYRDLVAKLTGWDTAPGKGPGTIDAFDPQRSRHAR